MTSTTAAAVRPLAASLASERFYVRMAAAFLVVGFVGFAPTYWVPLLRGTLVITPLAHVHALFFYGWLLLFLKQSTLGASGRLVRHREMGVLGVAVATGMCLLGLAMAMASILTADAAGFGEAGRRFSIVSISAALLFGGMFAAALLNVRRPDVHKRILVIATAAILQAAVGRWFLLFLAPSHAPGVPVSPPPVFVTVLPGLAVDLLIVFAMVHDRRTTGRVHPAYWFWGAVVLAVQLLRVPLSATSAWMHVPQWLIALAP